jgi:hypothetical protein
MGVNILAEQPADVTTKATALAGGAEFGVVQQAEGDADPVRFCFWFRGHRFQDFSRHYKT